MRALAVAICFLGLFAFGGAAWADDFGGVWQQISSNAGQCPTCRITISGPGPELAVQANNGWRAVVRPMAKSSMLSGSGDWAPNTRRTYSGKPLTARFVLLRDDMLLMEMTVHLGAKKRIIRATFRREALVS